MSKNISLIPVDLGHHLYDIRIGSGLIAQLPARLETLAPKARLALITDKTVAAHHLAALEDQLTRAGRRFQHFILPVGESTKSFACFQSTCETLIENRFERNDLILAFGGGIIGDLAGFVAASLFRGLPYIQIPTTLLAQVDSSIGGKTGINSVHGKNLIGAFHHPIEVMADLDFLETLPLRDRRSGYAEIVKYGLINDPDFFALLEKEGKNVIKLAPICQEVITHSCRNKVRIVSQDEKEKGQRALLNLGHTFAHALENITGYDAQRLLHGEAVTIGLVLAYRFSLHLGVCQNQNAPERIKAHLQSVKLPTDFKDIPGTLPPLSHFVKAMAQDKKIFHGNLAFILVKDIGDAFLQRDVPYEKLHTFLQEVYPS